MFIGMLIVAAMIAAGCVNETSTDDTFDASSGTSTDIATGEAVTVDGDTDALHKTDGTYRLALLSDPTTDNPWAALDTEVDVWTSYVMPGQSSLYTYQGPTYTLVPLLAADINPPQPSAEDDGFSVVVNLRSDVTWTDGSPITAHDMAFTFETVTKYDGLGGNFPSLWPLAQIDDTTTEEDESSQGVSHVEALDDTTVKITFNFDPGLAIWPFSVGFAPIFQREYWEPKVDASPDTQTLYAISGMGSPNASAFNTVEHEKGAFWRNETISDYWNAGSRFKVFDSGTVHYTTDSGELEVWGDANNTTGSDTDSNTTGNDANNTTENDDTLADYIEGPYVSDVLYSVYTDQNTAVLALTENDVDFILNPLGLQSGLRNKVLASPDLDVAVNEAAGFRYLAFNTRKFPMNELAFRQALACRIDKEFMANTVLGGSAIPLDSLIPSGQTFWHNKDITSPCANQNDQERLETAVTTLKEAGWTWDVEPVWDEENLDVIPKGQGLRGPNGEEIQPLTLLAPGPGYDPMRATYSLFIEEWATDMGIPLAAEPTGFSVIVDKVVTGDPLEWDLYILGWSVTPFPDHVFRFFESSADSALGGHNTTGYSNTEFDKLAERFKAAKTLEEARDLVHQGEAIIVRDMPYVLLFNTPLIEAYSNRLSFPFTNVLDGLQAFGALSSVVRIN